MGSRKAASLSNELHVITTAIEGVKRRAAHLGLDAGGEDGRDLQAIASQLTTLRDRLVLLDRVVRGAVDPRLLWCAENHALAMSKRGAHDEQDVVFEVWSDRTEARRYRRLWKMARSRLQRGKEQR